MWCKQHDGPVFRLDKFKAAGQKEFKAVSQTTQYTQVCCLNCNDGVFSTEKCSLRRNSAVLLQYYTCIMILYCAHQRDVTVTDCQVTEQNLTVMLYPELNLRQNLPEQD